MVARAAFAGATLASLTFVALARPALPPEPARRASIVVDEDGAVAVLEAEEVALRRAVDDRLRGAGHPWPPRGADPIALGAFQGVVAVATQTGGSFVVGLHARGAAHVVGVTRDLVDQATPSPSLLARQRPSAGRTALAVVDDKVFSLYPLSRRVLVSAGDAEDGNHAMASFEGALFSLAAAEERDRVTVVVGGLEDAPLDRTGGSFGHIDSFVYVLDVGDDLALTRRAAINTSAIGVVTPKAVAIADGRAYVAGAGSGTVAVIDLAARPPAVVDVLDGIVGAADAIVVAGHLVLASPLADAIAIVELTTGTRRVVPISDPAHANASAISRLGEALLTTTALAPEQQSDGPLSRFTCEACHRDLGVDGRVHATGRLDVDGREVVASTKPLRGVFQNAPLFSRAYDESVGAMVHAEVRVANANSERGAWTPLYVPADAPALRDVVSRAEVPDVVDPLTQRRAMLTFLAELGPAAPVAHAEDEAPITPTTADWAVFDRHCVRCHAARTFADDPRTTVQDAEERERLWRRQALVWASERRVDVGVRPLVRAGGARTSSLRGVSAKGQLLTSGVARDLERLLARLRVTDDVVWHEGHEFDGVPLGDDDRAALRRVLESL